MIDLKLLAGSVAEVVETEAYKKFYMHRTGHWLGLDVHDAGDYKRGGEWRALAPGMVLTVEPGCYIRPGEGVPERFAGIGVRIEDDVAGDRMRRRGADPRRPEASRRHRSLDELARCLITTC